MCFHQTIEVKYFVFLLDSLRHLFKDSTNKDRMDPDNIAL